MIKWKKYPSLSECIQDVSLNIIDNKLVYTCGFCSGHGINDKLYNKMGNKKKKYIRGFKNKTFIIDLYNPNKWERLDNFPGVERQCMKSCSIDNKIYYMGGFSYEPNPNKNVKQYNKKKYLRTHNDCYYLECKDNIFKWYQFLNLPIDISNFSICHFDNKIYLLGGGTIFDYSWQLDVTDNNDEPVNKYLYILDLNDDNKQWKILSRFEGSPRINFNMNIIKNNIYIIGGIMPNKQWKGKQNQRMFNVYDNWVYDVNKNTWKQINSDIIDASNCGTMINNVYDNRYIIFIGGAIYKPDMDKSVDDIIVYDIQKNEVIQRDKFFINIGSVCSIMSDDKIYLLSGETPHTYLLEDEYFSNHSDMFIIGNIDSSYFKI